MEKNVIGKIITVFAIICATIEIGIGIGYYMLATMDFNKFNTDYKMEIAK